MIRRRLWFLLRTWANDTLRSPVCDHCGKRHSDTFSMNTIECNISKYRQAALERQERDNLEREPKRLLSA